MNPVPAWLTAFVLTAITAAALVVGERRRPLDPVEGRDPAKLSDVNAELILNRIREGDLIAIQGDLDAARALWKSAREKGAGFWPIHEALGDSLARHGLDAEAEGEYETANRISAKQLGRTPAALNLKRAGLLVRMKRPEPALRLLIECGTPDRLAGAMARILKDSPDLLEVVKQAADTRDPRLWALVAATSPVPADQASALGRFARAVAPGDGELAKRAVGELRKHARIDEALLVCAAWAKAAPTDAAVYETWGRVLAESGQRDRARLVLSTIADVRPGDASAHTRLGVAFRDLGDHADAIRQFEEAARLRPEEPGPMQEVVATLLSQGNFDAAVAKFTELNSRKWESRFGSVGAELRSRIGNDCLRKIDEAKRAGQPEVVTRLRKLATDLGVAEVGLFDIKIVMMWDAASDVDLDVTEPGGETINHQRSTSKSGAVYHYDNTQGKGPEHYTLRRAPKGTYKVGVHLHGSTPSIVVVEVILFEDTPREKRLKAKVELGGSKSAVWPLEFEIP